MYKYLPIAFITIVVLATASGVVFLSLKKVRLQNNPKTAINISPLPTTAVFGVNDSTPEFQKFTDSKEYFAVELPHSWSVGNEASQDAKLTGMMAKSPGFSVITNTATDSADIKYHYETGAQLEISVEEGDLKKGQKPIGLITEQRQLMVNGESASYFIYKEKNAIAGEQRLVQLDHNGNSYFIRFIYNPETYADGKEIFETILNSLKLLK